MRTAAPRRRGGPAASTRPATGGHRTPGASTRPATGGHRTPAPRGSERLQKVLSRAGVASRREVETWIRAGRLSINGQPVTLGGRVRPGDQIRLDGRIVHARTGTSAPGVFLCHRSPGEPLAEETGGATASALRTNLLERLPRRSGRRFIAVSPMPRVDGGLELVSADGELAERLQRSVHALTSEFGVRMRGELSEPQLTAVLRGTLDSGAQLAIERCESAGGEAANRWYTVAVRGASGKQVRQLFERSGALVSRVLRTRLGPLTLERSLKRGRFRELTDEELYALLGCAAELRALAPSIKPGR
ncbi:MAG: 23S rRNA pseudouridylate synthase B [Gammaproteobacteria bacterium]|nr:23S rRNA pseudouridylate synthase B [Gammaproteobacteria bacterium]